MACIGVTDNAYNIAIQVLTEQGITGIAIAILACGLSLLRLFISSPILFYGMTSLLIFSMFSYPFDLLPYKIFAAIVIAWSESNHGFEVFKIKKNLTTVGIVFLLFISIMASLLIRDCYNAQKTYNDIRGYIDTDFIKTYYEILPLQLDNESFLFDMGKLLRKTGKKEESNTILEKGLLRSADPAFYILLGKNYKDMQNYKLAEQSFNKAFTIMPNRLYPLYLLMEMYSEQNEISNARAMAERILHMSPKIYSPATREIKRKAQEFLDRGN